MNEKQVSNELIKKTVRELLNIVSQADSIPRDGSNIQKFFIEHRKKIISLGKLVAVLSGIHPKSVEADKFGKLLVFNYICSNVVSIQFLHQILLEDTLQAHTLKTQITNFVRELTEYAEKDKKDFLACMQQERLVLNQLKSSEKAAKENPEWLKEIELLEKRINNISILIKDKKPKPELPQKSVKTKKSKQNTEFLEILDTLTHFTCFCGFKKRKRPSKYDILREITISMLETEKISYISVMPFLCTDHQKLNIEMCSPQAMDINLIKCAKQYIQYILKTFIKYIHNDEAIRIIKEIIKEYKETKIYNRIKLANAFLMISPARQESIHKAMNSLTVSVFYINVIRVIYLLIHDFAYNRICEYKDISGVDLHKIFLRENKEYHKLLIHKYSKSPNNVNHLPMKIPTKKMHRMTELSLEFMNIHDLKRSKVFNNKFYLVRTISDGIFSKSGVLSDYFEKYHGLRISILQSLLIILTKRITQAVKHKIHKNANNPNMSNIESKYLTSIIRRRILSTLHIFTIRFLKTNSIKPRSFIYTIPPYEFDRRGLPLHYNELCMFFLLAMPVFAYSADVIK
ncbi:hypothetical protein NEPAR06_2149 [Nematocida parisii]|nr:hypothetical protein NEPAR06_2149 [Nematocida parisii]